jgi:hypothetical protein
MIPTDIEAYWNKILQCKSILNNNSALAGMNLYLINNYARCE